MIKFQPNELASNTNGSLQKRVIISPNLVSDGACPEISKVLNHAADPVKKEEDIARIVDYLTEQKRYRDKMLFVMGINFGLRISDLLSLRFGHIINEDMSFKETFEILEKKTKNTRKRSKNRYVVINDIVVDVVTEYIQHSSRTINLSDYIFQSQSNHGSGCNRPLHRVSCDRILKGIGVDLNLPYHMSTHLLRKTFAYHFLKEHGFNGRALMLLQYTLGHKTIQQTLDYAGITKEEIIASNKNLNLGGQNTSGACLLTRNSANDIMTFI